MKYEVWSWYLLGALMGAAVALAGTVVAVDYIESNTPVVTCQDVAHKGEVLEAPESPVEELEVEEALEVIQEQDKGVVRRPARPRRNQSPTLDINLDSNDPLEGI